MFTKKELNLLDKVNLDQKFLNSKKGRRAAMQGYEDAAKQAAKY